MRILLKEGKSSISKTYAFENFFRDLKSGDLSREFCTELNRFFDPEGFTVDNYDLEHPIMIEKWFSISENDDYPNSIIIKNDGVIFYNYHQKAQDDGKVIIPFSQLKKALKTLFCCIIPEIYQQMEYEGKLKHEFKIFDLSNCFLRESPTSLEAIKTTSDACQGHYESALEELGKVQKKILTRISEIF